MKPKKTDASRGANKSAKIDKTTSAAPAKSAAAVKPVAPAKPVAPPEPRVEKTPVAKAAEAPRPAASRAKPKPLKVPPILLEGDSSPAPSAASGPGQRYALGPTPPIERFATGEAELPAAYGTQQLYLMARDPRWVYAHWDFSPEELKACNAKSADGHMVLRVFRGVVGGEPFSQIHLHPQSRDWFVPVPHAGTKYAAELGYYETGGKWIGKARSAATITPLDTLADDAPTRFATIPAEVPFEQLVGLVKAALIEHVPLAEALLQLKADGHKHLPAADQIASQSHWTPQQEKALAQVVLLDKVRRVWIGSVEITELIRRQLERQVSSLAAAGLGAPPGELAAKQAGAGQLGELAAKGGLPTSPAVAPGAVTSPVGGMPGSRGFWFNVNAELIIYGSTEADAKLTVAGRQVKLRRDGSFSFRFALPDGDYGLPVSAQSADEVETRVAELSFRRQSRYHGDVQAHPQDKQLQPPDAAAIA